MSWTVAKSLDVLLAEVNKVAPGRSKVSDGSIGDAAHATRDSDHNPWLNNTVRARDFTDDPKHGFSAGELASYVAGLLGKHPALGEGAYVIWNRRIISASRLGEGWRPYTGSNPHTKHVHISVGLIGYNSTAPWGWASDKPNHPNPSVPHSSVEVRIAHYSGLYKNSLDEWRSDTRKVFSRKYDWITGTEVGEEANYKIVKNMAFIHGYKIMRFRDVFIAVKRDIIKPGSYRKKSAVVALAAQTFGRGHDTVTASVRFKHVDPRVGVIGVVASHYPNRGRPDAKDPAYRVNLKWTKAVAKALVSRMEKLGRGRARLAFYGGDQNIVDRFSDTFFGGPVTSCWDELKKWPDTGHGNIDVIASFDKDRRAVCLSAKALDDETLPLFSDHYLIEATYDIKTKKAKP